MEVGKLETSSQAHPSGSAKGNIFYFILDEEYPDEPRSGFQRYFYVVSSSPSYVEAYCFLCHSLCERGSSLPSKDPGTAATASSHSGTTDTPRELDRSSTKLRQWYQLYVRVFGATTLDRFLAQVRAAPVGRLPRSGSRPQDPMVLPQLFTDETSARSALDSYQRTQQADGKSGATAQRSSAAAVQRRSATTARQQTSCTPEKRATPTGPALAPPRPSTAPGKSFYSVSQFQQHQAAQARHPAPPPPKLSSQATSVADLPPQDVARRRLGTESAATPVEVVRGARGKLDGTNKGNNKNDDAERATVRELKRLLEDVRVKAEQETSRLRMDVVELKRTLLAERESHDGLLREAMEKGRAAKANQNELKAAMELTNLKTKLSLAEQQVSDLRDALGKERELGSQQAEKWRKEVQQLHDQLREQSQEHGERLRAVVQDNKAAVDRLDAHTQAKEEELRNLYEDAIQSRDVRIAQLSEKVLSLEKSSRQAQSEVEEAQRRCEELVQEMHRRSAGDSRSRLDGPSSWSTQQQRHDVDTSALERESASTERNAALQRELSALQRENARLREGQHLPHADTAALWPPYERLEGAYAALLQEKKAVETHLSASQEQNAKLQAELSEASYLVQTLKDGLETVRNELPLLRKEIFLPLKS